MFLNALAALLAEVAHEVQTSLSPNAPISLQAAVILITMLTSLLPVMGTFALTIVNAILTYRNGMKSDLNAAKADVNSAKQDATHTKLEEVSKRLNGELDAKLKTLAETTYAAGANSVATTTDAAEKAKEVLAAAVPIAAELVKHAAQQAAETQKLNP